MASTPDEFIVSMVNTIMLFISQVNQAVITTPTIRMYDAILKSRDTSHISQRLCEYSGPLPAIPAYPLANYILPYMGCNVKIITAYCDNIMNIIQ